METTTSRKSAISPLHDFLIEVGTNNVSHSGRTLYEHLCGVESILRAWEQPLDVCVTGMFHSIYSTEKFRHATLPLTERARLQSIIGDQAERLVYLFSVLPRQQLLEFADSSSCLSSESYVELPCHWDAAATVQVSRDEIVQLVLLHMANRVEQAGKPPTGIGFWLSFLGDRVRSLRLPQETVPKALAGLGNITRIEESRLHSLYLQGISALQNNDASSAHTFLERACRECGVVGEPWILLAVAHHSLGDSTSARQAAWKGREILRTWGTPWHKRMSIDRWCELSDLITGGVPNDEIGRFLSDLFSTNDQSQIIRQEEVNAAINGIYSSSTWTHQDGSRFLSYLRNIQIYRSKRSINWYPGLSRTPWPDPSPFAVVKKLEAQFAEIRAEALKVQPDSYHEEAEGIGRTGSWQVCMFYEQGRRNDFVCNQCPVTSSILDSDPDIRRSAGLIYLSRTAPHTHIAPHQGSSNQRLRCHLALSIPPGDCAIRVHDTIRQWEEGKCIVFDDTYEHEVWNRTEEDRIVLLVDLWHPDLTDLERDALEAINWLGISRANGIVATWQRNDAQRREEGKPAYFEAGHSA
jgi:aspartate beta-hydroxylase